MSLTLYFCSNFNYQINNLITLDKSITDFEKSPEKASQEFSERHYCSLETDSYEEICKKHKIKRIEIDGKIATYILIWCYCISISDEEISYQVSEPNIDRLSFIITDKFNIWTLLDFEGSPLIAEDVTLLRYHTEQDT